MFDFAVFRKQTRNTINSFKYFFYLFIFTYYYLLSEIHEKYTVKFVIFVSFNSNHFSAPVTKDRCVRYITE